MKELNYRDFSFNTHSKKCGDAVSIFINFLNFTSIHQERTCEQDSG